MKKMLCVFAVFFTLVCAGYANACGCTDTSICPTSCPMDDWF